VRNQEPFGTVDSTLEKDAHLKVAATSTLLNLERCPPEGGRYIDVAQPRTMPT
jgi:hypothetical protein